MNRKSIITAIVLALLTSSCTPVDPYPDCPTDEPEIWLVCAHPGYKEAGPSRDPMGTNKFTEWVIQSTTSYCTEDIEEWLPMLDRNLPIIVPKLRETIVNSHYHPNHPTLRYSGLRSLKSQDLYRTALSSVLIPASQMGSWGETGSCREMIEDFDYKGFIEYLDDVDAQRRAWEKENPNDPYKR